MTEYRIAYELRWTSSDPKDSGWTSTYRNTIFGSLTSAERAAASTSGERGVRNVSIESREVSDWSPLSELNMGGEKS